MSVAAIAHGGAGAGEPFETVGAGLRRGRGVSPTRQQEIVDALSGLVPRVGRLSPSRLHAVTVRIAEHRELWADLVVHDADVRWYLPLHRSNSCDVWLLAWERGQDTDWHDHGGSSGSFAVAEGRLVEKYRAASGRRLSYRDVAVGQAVAFGPGHVHNVAHGGAGLATSIHAYSPPLLAMTYYQETDYGLVASQTVGIDGAEGARGRGGAETALADASASAAELASHSLPRRSHRRCGPGRHPVTGAADCRGRGSWSDPHRPQRARVAPRPAKRRADSRPRPIRRFDNRDLLRGLRVDARGGKPAAYRAAPGHLPARRIPGVEGRGPAHAAGPVAGLTAAREPEKSPQQRITNGVCLGPFLASADVADSRSSAGGVCGCGRGQTLLDEVRQGQVGSVLDLVGVDNINQVQQAALQSRLHIPVIFSLDVIHGYKTIFPVPIGEASSWNPAAVQNDAAISADEAAADAIKWTFNPMADISRDPR